MAWGPSPMALSVREVKMALGDEVIEGIAENAGVSEGFASGVLGYAIPKIIGLLTSGGAIPGEILSAVLSSSWLGTPVFGAARPGFYLRGREASSAARNGRRWPCRGAPFGCSRRGAAYYARIVRICHFIWWRGRSCTHPIRVQCRLDKFVIGADHINGDFAVTAGWIKNLSEAFDGFRSQGSQALFAGNVFHVAERYLMQTALG